ncbi:MAG: hypothetical protein JWN94_4943 [Betaproteobacteria bacterium]|nr:hypothetical protein [Betaproteobacteria bacterium]
MPAMNQSHLTLTNAGWTTLRALAAVAMLAGCVYTGTAAAAIPGIVIQSLKGEFDDVKERLTMAIENRGLVIDHISHVGAMLDRTGKDIGRNRKIYLNADVLQFCSAAVSRATMEADPRNLVFCPYAIALYVLPAEPDRVYLLYRKPLANAGAKSMKALREVDQLLDGIMRETLK